MKEKDTKSTLHTLPYIPDDLEKLCVAVRKHGNTVYMYPFDADVARTHAKVVTRDGKHTVKQLMINTEDDCITGLIDGNMMKWDIAGRYRSPYVNSPWDLFIPERYFDPDWKSKIKMSNADWQEAYGREHNIEPDDVNLETYREATKDSVSENMEDLI